MPSFRRLANPYLWLGIAGLLAVGVVLYVVVDRALMPWYTRQSSAIAVPAVARMDVREAEARLTEAGLKVERLTRRFDPSRPRGQVIEQEPLAGQPVKPGRLVVITVNEGAQPRIRVPDLVGSSMREARTRLASLGLPIREERPDSIPSPYRNTITQQAPTAGAEVSPGTGVVLFYSTGPSDQMEFVPDVTGQTVAQARATLLQSRLRALVVTEGRTGNVDGLPVMRQSRAPGTRVRGGFEVRLYLTADTTSVLAPTPPDPGT